MKKEQGIIGKIDQLLTLALSPPPPPSTSQGAMCDIMCPLSLILTLLHPYVARQWEVLGDKRESREEK